jgi:hypothetical protein
VQAFEIQNHRRSHAEFPRSGQPFAGRSLRKAAQKVEKDGDQAPLTYDRFITKTTLAACRRPSRRKRCLVDGFGVISPDRP